MTVALECLEPDFERAELRLEALRPPLAPMEIRVFIDEPRAGAQTPTHGNPHYLGSQFIAGLGDADVAPEPENPYRLGRSSQSTPAQLRLNVTAGLRGYLGTESATHVPITFVIVDRHNNAIAEPDLEFEAASVVTT